MSIKNSNDEPAKDVLIGRNCVQEAIRSGRPVDKVLVAAGERSGSIAVIIKRCRELKIPVKEVSPVKLDEISCHGVHQGIVAFVAAKGFDVLPALHAYLHSLRVGIRNVKPVREESFDRKSLQAE